MRFRKFQRQAAGTPIKAATMNAPAEQSEWSGRIRAESPLGIVSTPAGPLLRWAGMIFSVHLARTTTGITARSGGTPGSGTVGLYRFNSQTGNLEDTGASRTAYNFSAGNPYDSGKYCVVLQICGVMWILSIEC